MKKTLAQIAQEETNKGKQRIEAEAQKERDFIAARNAANAKLAKDQAPAELKKVKEKILEAANKGLNRLSYTCYGDMVTELFALLKAEGFEVKSYYAEGGYYSGEYNPGYSGLEIKW